VRASWRRVLLAGFVCDDRISGRRNMDGSHMKCDDWFCRCGLALHPAKPQAHFRENNTCTHSSSRHSRAPVPPTAPDQFDYYSIPFSQGHEQEHAKVQSVQKGIAITIVSSPARLDVSRRKVRTTPQATALPDRRQRSAATHSPDAAHEPTSPTAKRNARCWRAARIFIVRRLSL